MDRAEMLYVYFVILTGSYFLQSQPARKILTPLLVYTKKSLKFLINYIKLVSKKKKKPK